jgi:hypothetical protein
VLYWLGLCQATLANLIEDRPGPDAARERLRAMLILGLAGLGASPQRAQTVADMACERL